MSEARLFALFAKKDIDTLLAHKALVNLLVKKGIITAEELESLLTSSSFDEKHDSLLTEYRKDINDALLGGETE